MWGSTPTLGTITNLTVNTTSISASSRQSGAILIPYDFTVTRFLVAAFLFGVVAFRLLPLPTSQPRYDGVLVTRFASNRRWQMARVLLEVQVVV